MTAISRVVEERSDDTPGSEAGFPSDPGRDRSNAVLKPAPAVSDKPRHWVDQEVQVVSSGHRNIPPATNGFPVDIAVVTDPSRPQHPEPGNGERNVVTIDNKL